MIIPAAPRVLPDHLARVLASAGGHSSHKGGSMTVFAGFEVLGQAARGSTGIVWQARQITLDRLVAIKELAPALMHLPGFVERFRSEAQLLAGLDDPHVVRLFDYVEEPGRAYLVEEWVQGAALASVLDRHGRLTAEQSLGVIRGGLIGLAHAHERGLVHRDVSLSNILLGVDGVSKLVDFGLAAPVTRNVEPVEDGFAASVGTPAFGSPEAVLGQSLTPSSDVYSAAAVLYTLLTGSTPYVGRVQAMLSAHVNRPAPVLTGFASRLTNLLSRAMDKRPHERPADAAAFLAELEEAAREAYGADWLSRASVAGLVTALVTGATAAVASTASSGAGQVPAASVIQAGSRRVLGLPRGAFLAGTAALVIVVAAVAVALALNAGSDRVPAADPRPATNTTAAGDTGSAAAGPSAQRFSGTYSVIRTLTSVPPNAPDPVGLTTESTWTATASCTSGPCDVSVVTSFGLTYDFVYGDGVWRAEIALELPCFDQFGQETAETVPATDSLVVSPGELGGSGEDAPLATLSGTTTEMISAECGGGPGGTFEIALQLTRTGD